MDGQDYAFREKVASQYKTRVVLRSQLKKMLLMTTIPWLFIVLHLLEVRLFDKLQINIDQAGKMWQQIYAFSILTTLLCLLSMKKNSVLQLTLAVVTNLATSLIPIAFLAYKALLSSQKNSMLLLAFSMTTFFMHFLALKQSLRLRSSWQVVKTK